MGNRTQVFAPERQRLRALLVLLAVGLFSIFAVGLFSLATDPLEVVTFTLAYTSGLSMIVLPCTLPAVFVIIPLSMGREPRRGLTMAALFGLGLTITIALYGVAVAALGRVLYLDQVTLLMWLAAGTAAYLFGLSELGLTRWQPPSYGAAQPAFLEERGDSAKAFLLGLLLGNAGIGCPNPAFYVLLTYLAGTGSLPAGLAMGTLHGIGRATPLLAIALLGLLGVSATGWLLLQRERVTRLIGWGLIGVGTLLIPKPLFGHAWWEESVFHKIWNGAVHRVLGPTFAESAEAERLLGDVPVHDPWLLYGPWAFVGVLLALPILWRHATGLREEREVLSHAR